MKAEEISKGFTDWLHEVFVYILPASIWFLGVALLVYRFSPSHANSVFTAYQRIDQGIDKAVILLIVFFILYYFGVLIQSISYVIIYTLTGRLASLLRRENYFYSDVAAGKLEKCSIKQKRKDSFSKWVFDQAKVSSGFPDVGKWSRSEFSRLALSRSLSLVFLTLTLLGLWVKDLAYSVIALTAFLLTVVDIMIRREWVNVEVNSLVKAISKITEPEDMSNEKLNVQDHNR